MVAVLGSQAIAERLRASGHAHDNGVVTKVAVQAVLQALQEPLQQPCKVEPVACTAWQQHHLECTVSEEEASQVRSI